MQDGFIRGTIHLFASHMETSIALVHFYFCFPLDCFPYYFTESFSLLIWSCWCMLRRYFPSDRFGHMCFALEPDIRFLPTLQMNAGGVWWVEVACLMLWFLHFSKQPSLWLLHKTIFAEAAVENFLRNLPHVRVCLLFKSPNFE